MKLCHALLLTGVIAGSVTFLAWAQPLAPETRAHITNAASEPGIATKSDAKSLAQSGSEILPKRIYGMTRFIALENAGNLVELLLQREDVYTRLKPGPHKIFIIYQKFSKNYHEARVTVGLPKESFLFLSNVSEPIPDGDVTHIGGSTDTSPDGLEGHWQLVHFGPTLQAVIEKYTLSENGIVRSVDIYQVNEKQ
ncbi:hypothetical protein P3339_02685 [Microbulbifer sp. MLAF003]|uniref:hypothetical protein n=1 Tax=unclassified Microbulbifer TaxID=2619833 RepID=UPI0024AC832A|nr:hypothetical protein [Microbulbifer sp. MLAF003]WHI51758.1 hypothetical protein P3339_02685 [Microbulbifer sp. MLAF003]